jgi:acylglycerol lipase
VNIEGKNAKRRTGGWARVMPDIEWFVRREHERAKQTGGKLFLWGFSMVRLCGYGERDRAD